MSRIGNKPIAVPSGVTVAIAGSTVTLQGPKGKLDWTHPSEVSASIDDATKQIIVKRADDERRSRAMHGLSRAMINNMVVGVSQGYEKRLEIHGVGYLAAVAGKVLQLRVGFANELQVPITEGLTVTVPDQQHIVIQGIDKQKVGHFAASVRALRKPEPYKGKGIRYMGEVVRRKQGKAMAK